MTRMTCATINKALKAAGHAERLYKGKDYYYFADGDAHKWPSSSVCVYHIDSMTIEEWIAERNDLASKKSFYRS